MPTNRTLIRPAAIGLVGLILGVMLAASVVDGSGGPQGLIRAPEGDPRFLAHIEELVGPVPTSPQYGHDGKFFLLLALDPFLTDKESLGEFLDNPAYRAERILYPMLAGGFGLLRPSQVLWGLVVVNVLAIGLGSWAAARVSGDLGLPTVLGLFFALNPGVIYELGIDSASVLGFALGLAGVSMVMRKQLSLAVVAFALAGLSRETMVLMCIGVVLWLLVNRRIREASILSLPIWLTGAWLIVIRLIMPQPDEPLPESFSLPFQGLIDVIPDWISAPDTQRGVLAWSLICALVSAVAVFRRPGPLSWSVACFLPLTVILSEPVARYDFNLTRAVMPLLTAGPIFAWAFATRSGRIGDSDSRTHPTPDLALADQ